MGRRWALQRACLPAPACSGADAPRALRRVPPAARYNVSCNAELHMQGGGGGGSCGVPVEQVIRGVAQAGPRRGCDLQAQLDQLQR